MEKVILDYLQHLNISVSKTYFRKSVTSHSEYPSILSVSDTLERFGIKHAVAKVQEEDLENFPFPFVLHLKRGQGQLLLIRSQQDLREHESDREDWDGVILLVEESEVSIDEEHQEYLSREKTAKAGLVILGVSALLFFGMILTQHFTWYNLLLFITAVAGTILGLLLTAKDVGIRYNIVESFCNAGQNINCDRVLTSAEATLFGRFKLSDTVLSYFTFQLIATGIWLPVGNEVSTILSVLFVFTMLSIPVVGYSLYLQSVKLKSWCRLCLLVGAVLLAQTVLFGWLYSTNIFVLGDAGFWIFTQLIVLLVVIGSLEFLLKSRLEEDSEVAEAEIRAIRIKYSPEVFKYLLVSESRVDTTSFEKELLIGRTDTPIEVMMAASLGCGPCKEGFEKAVQLVKHWPAHVNLRIRFLMPTVENNTGVDPAKHLLNVWLQHIYGKENQSEETIRLFKEWYALLNLEKFKEKYLFDTNGQSKNLGNMVDQHANWFKREGIHGTPTFFVNNYKLPAGYRIEDISMLFPGLLELVPFGEQSVQKKVSTS